MKSALFATLFALIVLTVGSFLFLGSSIAMEKGEDLMSEKPQDYPVATLAGGCFWCLESEFRALDGVLYTRSGYIGGHVEDPTYRDVTTGKSGHAEAVEITYDPEKITYAELLEYFFTKAHDPTQINRQGVDEGPQYRSGIFYHDETQEKIARKMIADYNAAKRFKKPIATEVTAATTFWEAEQYHQQYYEKYEEENGRPHIRVMLKQAKKLKP